MTLIPRNFFAGILVAAVLFSTTCVRATRYAPKFEGRKMANGRIFHQYDMVAATNLYPLGAWLRVTNMFNGQIIYVTVQDRPAPKFHGLDLSEAAYDALGITRRDGWSLVQITMLGQPER